MDLPCFFILVGSGKIIPQVGTLSGDACSDLSPLTDGATLELEVYFFDKKIFTLVLSATTL